MPRYLGLLCRPTWVPADDMRAAALRFVDVLERLQGEPGYEPLGALFTFVPGGQAAVRSPTTGQIRDPVCAGHLARSARRMNLSPATVDWTELVSAMLGHVAIWVDRDDDADRVEELGDDDNDGNGGGVIGNPDVAWSSAVLCPETLNRKRKALFGGHGGSPLRSVTADEMRVLIQSLPRVPRLPLVLAERWKKPTWRDETLVSAWVGRWAQTAHLLATVCVETVVVSESDEDDGCCRDSVHGRGAEDGLQ